MDTRGSQSVNSRTLKWLLILSPFLISLSSTMACLVPYYITVYYIGLMKNYKLNFISIYSNPIPSSGFFSLFLSLTNYFLFLLVLFQFLCIKSLANVSRRVKFINLFGFFIGLMSVLGCTVLQSFHIHTNRQIHYVASIGSLIAMLIYTWLQTFLTFMIKGSWLLLTLRFIISSTSTSLLIACSIYTDALYQWICIFILLMYFITFIPDMSTYEFSLSVRKMQKKSKPRYDSDAYTNDNDEFGSQPYKLNKPPNQVFSTYV